MTMRKILLIALFVAFAYPAFADETIDQLTAGSALTGTEEIPMFQGSNPAVSTTPNAIKTFIAPVTSLATACGVSGGPITNTGTISGGDFDNPLSATSYTILNADCGKTDRFTGATAAITVPVSTGFSANYTVDIKCEASATCVLTPSSTTINGSASAINVAVGSSLTLYLDTAGTPVWHTKPGNAAGGGFPGGSSGQIQTNNGAGGFGALATNANANHPGYSASIGGSAAWWLPLQLSYSQTSSGAFAANTAYCSIGEIGGTSLVTIQALGVVGTTIGSSNIQLAIYNNDTSPTSLTSYAPGTLIDSTPNIVNTATGSNSGNLNASHQLSPGFYWFCLQSNDTTYRAKAYAITSISAGASWVGASSANGAIGVVLQGIITSTGVTGFGTWPATFHGASFSGPSSSAPVVAFSLSSVP